MVFEAFSRLLELKFTLLRALHTVAPTERPSIRAAVAHVDARLAECDQYREFLRHYASLNRRIG